MNVATGPTPHIGGCLHDDQERRVRDICVGHSRTTDSARKAFKIVASKMPVDRQIDFLVRTRSRFAKSLK